MHKNNIHSIEMFISHDHYHENNIQVVQQDTFLCVEKKRGEIHML